MGRGSACDHPECWDHCKRKEAMTTSQSEPKGTCDYYGFPHPKADHRGVYFRCINWQPIPPDEPTGTCGYSPTNKPHPDYFYSTAYDPDNPAQDECVCGGIRHWHGLAEGCDDCECEAFIKVPAPIPDEGAREAWEREKLHTMLMYIASCASPLQWGAMSRRVEVKFERLATELAEARRERDEARRLLQMLADTLKERL